MGLQVCQVDGRWSDCLPGVTHRWGFSIIAIAYRRRSRGRSLRGWGGVVRLPPRTYPENHFRLVQHTL